MLESGTRFECAAIWESAEAKRIVFNMCILQFTMAESRPADYLYEESEESSDLTQEGEPYESQEEADLEDISGSKNKSEDSESDESASASALPPTRAVNRPRFSGYISVCTDDYPDDITIYSDTLYLMDGVRRIQIPMAESMDSPESEVKVKGARERPQKSVPETTP